MGRFHDLIHDLRQPTRDLRAAIPDAWAGYSELHQAAMADGALPGRLKELIALAIAAVNGCDGVSPITPGLPPQRRDRSRGGRSSWRGIADGGRTCLS